MVLYFPCADDTLLGRAYKTLPAAFNMPVALSSDELKSGEWKRLEICLAVPESAWNGKVVGVNCQLEARAEETHGKVWFDDFTVEELTDPALASLRHAEFRSGRTPAETQER